MKQLNTLLFILFVFVYSTTWATTWDEPWQDKVIKEADYFVLAKIIAYDEKEGVTVEVMKTLGGQEVKGELKITAFYLLDMCSSSGGHGPEFPFDNVKEGYFFIKKNDKGQYCMATPSAGFAPLEEGNVSATYRHSYHQAQVPQDVYEKTMTAIFNNYHNLPYDKAFIDEYVNKYLSLAPAGFEDNEINTFFAQHVALETAYHLRLPGFYDKIIPFLHDTSNFHNSVSGARALIAYNTPDCKKELVNIISDTTKVHFLQVICIWTLAEFKPTELKKQLIKVKATASAEDAGFGGNIMDPRVCTHFPDVKDALEKLITTL